MNHCRHNEFLFCVLLIKFRWHRSSNLMSQVHLMQVVGKITGAFSPAHESNHQAHRGIDFRKNSQVVVNATEIGTDTPCSTWDGTAFCGETSRFCKLLCCVVCKPHSIGIALHLAGVELDSITIASRRKPRGTYQEVCFLLQKNKK